MSSPKTYNYTGEFLLDSNEILEKLEIVYCTYGKLNAKKDNVIWVCHALTANAEVNNWWSGIFGKNKPLDPNKHFIVCANILGSCYGTTGPQSLNKNTGQPYLHEFPNITIKDMAKAHQVLANHLGINQIRNLYGPSMGGYQALQWAVDEPQFVENLILIATSHRQSAWNMAFNETQRMTIELDPTFHSNNRNGGTKGLAAARAIALLGYRGYSGYAATQLGAEAKDKQNAATYQRYQGQKFTKRFDAHSYLSLINAMDSFYLTEKEIATVQANCLIIGISSDRKFPLCEQQKLAKIIPGAILQTIESDYGHDGFLIETRIISDLITGFGNQNNQPNEKT